MWHIARALTAYLNYKRKEREHMLLEINKTIKKVQTVSPTLVIIEKDQVRVCV